MKRIYNIILAVSAFIAFSPAMLADDPPGQYSINGQINETVDGQTKYLEWPKDNGVHQTPGADFAYSKDISAPQSDGTYWIKLESFSTGVATNIVAAAPADIVLVLDLSSSMNNETGSGITIPAAYTSATPSGNGWTYSNVNTGGTSYILYNDSYYEVVRGDNGQNGNRRRYYLRFRVGNQYYYLNVYNITTDVAQFAGNNTVIYTGTLYKYTAAHGETRLDALKRATKAFIDEIEKNDKYEDEAGTIEREGGRLGNRISIITFNSSANTRVSLANGALTEGTAATLKTIVDGFTMASGTTPYNGFVAANAQLATIDAHRREVASRTVVFFTDGEPYDLDNGYGTGYRYKAVGEALKTKQDYGATVFSVGLFTTSPAVDSDTWRFLNYISSNAPNATTYQNHGDDWDADAGFYFDASEGVDLSEVFTEIAHHSGGSSSTLSAASSNVDVVSNSFVLPEGADAEHVGEYVKIFVAKLEKIENGNYVFYEEILKGQTPTVQNPGPQDAIDGYYYYPLNEDGEISGDIKKVDEGIQIALIGDNGIKVTGFDYSSNFCGPVYKTDGVTVDYYQGFKIIIMIPIKMNPDAVGGPDVKTNGAGSGIYVSNDATSAFVAYESPTVSLPVNIHITKKGLQEGESAKFRIERAVLPANGPLDYSTLTWSYVSTVFVTKSKGSTEDPIVKVRGLPANTDVKVDETTTIHQDFVYRVSEEPWSWSYDAETEPKYTNIDYMDNPIDFTNTKKPNIEVKVRHAESKATNVFVTGSTVKYDDSKDNGR
ncbi:MAG: VWA domain-containing protein [Bacteroidales bacterium]|nr:VWA domain-containing protein [Bacteroidales bacterium]